MPDRSEKSNDLTPWGRALRHLFVTFGHAVSRYTRLEYEGPNEVARPPALIVVNHGAGGVFDLNAFVIAALCEKFGIAEDTPATILAHQMIWTFGAGPILEPAGFKPASREAAFEALAEGQYVVVMPGGDIDAAKPWSARNEVRFGGRTGFASLAIEAGVPIIPLVIVGAGESMFVLTDGQGLAKATGADRLLRTKTIPISISIPWGLSVGFAGTILPYIPLPTKMKAAAHDPIWPEEDETAEELARRVHDWMSSKAEEMTRRRIPVLGWQI